MVSRSLDAKYLGDIVRVTNFKSCLEISKIGAKTLQILYLTCRPDDLQKSNFTQTLSDEGHAAESQKNFKKAWKVLFASGPVLVGNDESALFCGARQLAAANANDPAPIQVKFLRLPIKRTSRISPGTF